MNKSAINRAKERQLLELAIKLERIKIRRDYLKLQKSKIGNIKKLLNLFDHVSAIPAKSLLGSAVLSTAKWRYKLLFAIAALAVMAVKEK